MRILLTNDDGINAPGLYVLEKIAAKLSDDIWIVAPSEEQSGAGHSLTLTRPVRMREHAPRRFSVTGTPTDAVTMALRKALPGPPDLILSGVNRGANLGDDVTYSGTVSAAMEGALAGIRSIALSQVYAKEGMGNAVSFDAAEHWGEKVLRPLVDTAFASRTLVNVNFPPIGAGEVKGIRVVRQGFHDYERGSVVEGTDPRGFPYFWFGLHGIQHTLGADTDLEAIDAGYISVTPLHVDLTHEASLGTLAERYRA
ncbi:5'/3'-nucleotidase SurE [Novosphingobium album (ex Liu et al. 2023)]|uniref:5'-nucleotidase SurE n=1 Tax=Novosphingobium album (ex Liu et al. 2023) TaxID=3031130 RepID=A0ABT5WRL0_9SPHN|nr:5'/3'-nucleotidase SurE [Novosphingobium album (ex Liu et al. 2023)]MDE8652687.1 5'/3'-nucleotidase SurE [Novosphingobium album (ex Liu et al. 2023)]